MSAKTFKLSASHKVLIVLSVSGILCVDHYGSTKFKASLEHNELDKLEAFLQETVPPADTQQIIDWVKESSV